MTPKEKAKELVNEFSLVNSKNYIDNNGLWDTEFVLTDDDAKQCALIAVNGIIKVAYWNNVKEYYEEVKQEIEKL